MQKYENKPEETNLWKGIVLEFLVFLKSKIENDTLTIGEVESIGRMIMENMELFGTIDELAAHYNKSKDAVNGVIKRRMIQRPRRNIVLYSLNAFSKIIPNSWRKSR